VDSVRGEARTPAGSAVSAVYPPATMLRSEREPILEASNLKTYFRTPRWWLRAVDGIDLQLQPGKMLGIVGESGSGKSVTSRSLMGTVQAGSNVHVSGSVRFDGVDLTALPLKERRKIWGKDLAMVFQDPMTALNPVVKVGRQITEGMRRHLGIGQKEATRMAAQLLQSVGIPEPERRLSEYPGRLSGGMRQRVSIAIALSCGPKILFADEPTTALDVTVQAQILDLIADQQHERNMSVVLVTHDLGVVAGYADEIAVMYAGKIVERAPTKMLFSMTRMPYTEALLNSIPNLEDPSHTRLQVIQGRPPDLATLPPGCHFAPRCPYAQDRCRVEEPPLVSTDDPRHEFACWFPIGAPPVDVLSSESKSDGSARTPAETP
jgi:peptide/nickel transport system ATP-binding protein